MFDTLKSMLINLSKASKPKPELLSLKLHKAKHSLWNVKLSSLWTVTATVKSPDSFQAKTKMQIEILSIVVI